jgi:hypothetical protein
MFHSGRVSVIHRRESCFLDAVWARREVGVASVKARKIMAKRNIANERILAHTMIHFLLAAHH